MRMDDRGDFTDILNPEFEESRFGCIGHAAAEFGCEFWGLQVHFVAVDKNVGDHAFGRIPLAPGQSHYHMA